MERLEEINWNRINSYEGVAS